MRRPSRALTIIRGKAEGGLTPGIYTNSDKAYAEYLTTLNPRVNPHIRASLGAAEDPRFLLFLQRIDSHKYAKNSLATIAKGCGITLRQFNDWVLKASSQRAIAVAQMAGPEIAADMAQDARTKAEFCERCDGLGWVGAPPDIPKDLQPPGYKQMGMDGDVPAYTRTCPKCGGKREVARPGDSHARDKILEMSGIVKKGALVNINQNFGGATHGAAINDLDNIMTVDGTLDD